MNKKMMLLVFLLTVICVLLSVSVLACNVQIDNVSAVVQTENDVIATVKFDITNNLNVDTIFNPYIAIYTEDGKLFSVNSTNKTILAGKNDDFSTKVSVPVDKTGIYGKIFVWNTENLKPLSEAKTFSIDISSQYEDIVITSNMTLENDVNYNNVILQSGTVNLNGYTMHVYGDLIQPGGTMTIGGGSLIVEGKYGIHTDTTDEEIIKSADGISTGILSMKNENDYVLVNGDFITNSNQGHYYGVFQYTGSYGYTTYYRYLAAGTIELKNGFYQYGYGSSNNFGTGGTHKVKFSGSSKQTIHFDSPTGSYFNDLELVNTDINFATSVSGWQLQRDTEINGNVSFVDATEHNGYSDANVTHYLNLNGYTLTINGKVIQIGTISINGGKLEVSGDFIQPSGTMTVGGGSLIVQGDYGIHAENADAQTIKSVDGVSSGILKMTNENDYVLVNGNFITNSNKGHYYGVYEYNGRYGNTTYYHYLDAGTLELKGDFYQYSYGSNNNFGTGGTHKVKLSGNEEQTVHFDTPNYSYFNDLETKNVHINFDTAISGWKLQRDTCIDGDVNFVNSTENTGSSSVTHSLNLNGYSLTVNGDIIQNGTINVNGGTLNVLKDLIQPDGTMTIGGGSLIVEGNYGIHADTKDEATIKSTQGTSTGMLEMKNENDYVLVKGDFITNSEKSHHYSVTTCGSRFCSTTNYFYLTAGIMEVKGEFYQCNAGGNSSNYGASNDHILILSGNSIQKIHFDSSSSYFCNLIITKPLETYIFENVNYNKLYRAYKVQTFLGNTNTQNGTYAPTGNYSREFSDLSSNTALGVVEFTRTYNSLDENSSAFGKGWSFGLDTKIADMYGIYKSIKLPGGSVELYKINENGTFTAENSRNTLTKSSDGTYVLQTKDLIQYVYNSNGFVVSSSDRYGNITKYDTDADGNITKITSATGATYTLSYSDGKVTEIKDNMSGRSTTFAYSDGKLVKSTNPLGTNVYYSYDSNGRLSDVKDHYQNTIETVEYTADGKVNSIIDVNGNKQTYSYDTPNKKTTITDSNGKSQVQYYDDGYSVTKIVDTEGGTSSTQYALVGGENKYNEPKTVTDRNGANTYYERDDKGNITKYTNGADGSYKAYEYDAYNNVISERDENGNYTYYVYDETGRKLLKTIKPLDGTSVYSDSAAESLFAITELSYYEKGENGLLVDGLIKTKIEPMGETFKKTEFTYYANGLLKSMTITDGIDGTTAATKYEYNNLGLIEVETAPNGIKTYYEYDAMGNKTKVSANNGTTVSTMGYDEMGRLVKELSPNEVANGGSGIRTTYFANGQPKTETSVDGEITKYTYDIYGNVSTKTLANGAMYQYTYDSLGRQLSVSFKDITSDEFDVTDEYAYAILSNGQTKTTHTVHYDANTPAATVSTFDYANRLIKQVNPDSTSISKTYYPNGLEKTSTDAKGNTASYSYDVFGNLIEEKIPFDKNYQYKKYEYDKNGNVTKMSVSNNVSGETESYSITEYEYNGRNMLIAVKNYNDGVIASAVQYVYDESGNKIREYTGLNTLLTINDIDDVVSNGDSEYSVEKYEYDYLGNITKHTDALGNVETFEYDKNGNLVKCVDRNGIITTYTYDSMNRVLTKQAGNIKYSYVYDVMGNEISVSGNNTDKTMSYDGLGNMLSETADSVTKQYTYDRQGNRISFTLDDASNGIFNTQYTYDSMGRLCQVIENGVVAATYQYDANGNRSKLTYANGNVTEYAYNKANFVTSLINKNADEVLSSYAYTYHLNGNQKTVTELSGVTTYTYDDLGQIIKAVDKYGKVNEYSYDDYGNRIMLTVTNGEDVEETSYVYDKNNRLSTETKGGISTTYSYDENGNMVSKTNDTITENHTYDAWNRLITVENNTGSYVYGYDDMLHRTSVSDGIIIKKQVWDGNSIVYENNGTDSSKYLTGVNIISSVNANDSSYFMYNAHGDVVALTDSVGEIKKIYEYDEFGNELNVDEADDNPFRFAGEYFDKETKTYYNRARYYDPYIGRFISQDSYAGNEKDILSLNGYTYCHNNPVYYVDSSGNSVVQAIYNISSNTIKSTATQIAKAEVKNAVYGLIGISNERPDYYSVYNNNLLNAVLKETGLEKTYSVFSTVANEAKRAIKTEISDSKKEIREFMGCNVLGNMAYNKAESYVKNEILNGIPGGKSVYGMCNDLATGNLKSNKTMQIFVAGLNYIGSSMGYDKVSLDTPSLYRTSSAAKVKASALKEFGANDAAAYWAEKYYSYSETAKKAPTGGIKTSVGGSSVKGSAGLSSRLGAGVKNSWFGSILGF